MAAPMASQPIPTGSTIKPEGRIGAPERSLGVPIRRRNTLRGRGARAT